jgi:hypothetical protein
MLLGDECNAGGDTGDDGSRDIVEDRSTERRPRLGAASLVRRGAGMDETRSIEVGLSVVGASLRGGVRRDNPPVAFGTFGATISHVKLQGGPHLAGPIR